ncbi:putative inactive dehydrogenase [Lachnellula occidentalis]|uniref:Putative inactive dehydrogenase n=1 Tax=Lachnellula occidentalis TaxID=215460 RepID=A0A8H8RBB8_9HELO|nr:putative inactive dehydrogenase [Lachnellula occidentalis]
MSTSKLFQPLKLGNVQLSNRIALAPLTRVRADDNHVHFPMAAEYYAQRGSVPGTFLISEATFIAPQAGGIPNVPGIWNAEQIAAWKKVTDAVHAKGSYIYLQLWALGRAAGAATLTAELGPDAKVKSASDIPFEGGDKPEALSETEVQEYIGLYAQAAKNAVEAGFDGVEVHSANGYLIDQFLQDVSNKRTDAWGGSVEKRARFGLEVVKAVIAAVGAEKTGIRISPYSTFQGMKMKSDAIVEQFSYYTRELKKLNLAYLHIIESREWYTAEQHDASGSESVKFLVDIWDNTSPVLLASGYKTESAYTAVDKEWKDKDVVIVFGRYFISNPDLVFRIKEKIELTPYDRSKFYLPKQALGYTDWPFSKEFEEAKAAGKV